MNSKRLFKLLFALTFASVILAGGLLLFDYIKIKEKFPERTYIGGIDVSGLSKEQAAEKLGQSQISDVFLGVLVFANSSESFSFSPKDLGIFLLLQETVDRAFDLSHSGNYFKNLTKRLSQKYRALPAKYSFVKEAAVEVVSEMASQIDSPAVDAKISLDESTGGYHIYPDKRGRKLRVNETIENLRKTLEEGGTIVDLNIEYTDDPRVTEAILRAAPPVYRLSAYTTYYGTHDSKNRIHNIKLIASWLNNTLLLPDEVVTLSERIGDFTSDRGFKEAFVIVSGELVPQLGGGTCQIGTTLYNAAALADLKILSRRNHSFYFNIYPLGRDATVYPGSADLKFKNNTGNPVLVKAIANNQKLSFRIYGTKTGKRVAFSNPEVYMLHKDNSFHPATLRQVIAADRPFRTVVVRTVSDEAGRILETETIRSYYKLYGEKSNVPIKRPEPR